MTKLPLLTVSGLLLLGLLVWRSVHHSGEILTDLVFGWAAFLIRIFPNLDVRWDGVAVFTTGLAGIIGISHYLLRWLASEMGKAAESSPRVWPLRSTIALVGFVIVMFTAGISVTGAAHQVVWLLRSDEPLFGQDLPKSLQNSSATNLRFIGLAIANHSDTFGTLPTQRSETSGEVRQSWVTQILPYLNYRTDTIDMQREWDDPVNAANFRAVIPGLCNPEFRTPPLRDERGFGLNHYAGNSRIFDRQEPLSIGNLPGGATNTLLVGEVNAGFVPWGQPENSRVPANGIGTPDGFGGAPGSHGATFLMADGSVRFVQQDVDPKLLEAMSSPLTMREK